MKTDFTRTPNGTQRIIDSNLKIDKVLKIPDFDDSPDLNDNPDEPGYIRYNSGLLEVYNGSDWVSTTGLPSGGTTTQYLRGDHSWQELTTSVVSEGSNLYYTSARFNTAFGTKTTTDLAEGTNKYYTDARVQTYGDSRYLQLSGGVLSGDVQQSTLPINATSLINKNYVDSLITGITWKQEVRVATTGNITLSGTQTIDGVAVAINDRVLVKNQTAQTANGIYLVASGAWTRSVDADTSSEIGSATVLVRNGTLQKNTQWTCTNSTDPVIGTDNITFGQISGAGTYVNGTGILLIGNVFSLDLTYTDGRYVSLTGSYANPSWITSLAQSKITYPGLTTEYIRGDGSLSTFPTVVSTFTNDSGYLNTIASDAMYLKLTGGDISGPVSVTNNNIASATAVSSINVFGTSYEGPGFGSTNPSTLSWVPQVKNATGWVINNQAVSSAFILDQTRFIYNTPVISRTLSIYDLEINDMNFYYTDVDKQAIFANEHLATVAYLAIPDSKKILANSSAVTYVGTWTAGKYAISKQTSGSGNTATFTISGTTVIVSTTVGDGFTGAFTIKIDGSTVGTYTNGTVASMATNNGSGITFGPSIKMFTGLSNTAHTVVITTTNANAVYFDWAAGVDTSTPNPSVFVMNTIYQSATGNPYPINNPNVDLYNSFVTSNISTLTGLGLNVTLIDVNSVINPATDVAGFGLHPNDAGYAKIATKVLAIIPSTFYNVGAAIQTQTSINNVAGWNVIKNTNPGVRAGVGIRFENDDSSNGAIFRASSAFTDGTPYGLYISNNSVSNNTVLTNDIIFNNGSVEALRLLSGNVRMPQFKTAGVITNASNGQLSSSTALSSTLGGSGVSNAGNLTWGSGGTLGSMAFISTASPTFTGTLTVPTGSFSGTQIGMFTAWPVNTLALFGASASGGAGYPFTGNNNALIAARPAFDIVFGTGNPTVTRGYISALSGNLNWGATSGTDLGALFSVIQPTTGNGTVSNAASGITVTGVGTQFTNTFKIGDAITIAGETQTITAIASNTSMTTTTWTAAHTAVAYTLVGGTRFQVFGNGNTVVNTLNKVTITSPTTNATLTLAQGSTLATSGAFSNTLTTTGTTNVTLPTTGTLATLSGIETFTNKTFTTPKLTGYTVSTLPAGSVGMLAYVTDALTPASLAIVVGGGSSVVPVFYNGTNWVVQ